MLREKENEPLCVINSLKRPGRVERERERGLPRG